MIREAMSDTPRTDAALMVASDQRRSRERLEMLARFTRGLERENAALQARIRELEHYIAAMTGEGA